MLVLRVSAAAAAPSMAKTTSGTVQIADMGTGVEHCKKLYDSWATSYEKDVRDWGYTMPEECARMLKKHISGKAAEKCRVLDAGAGDGLSGKALADEGFGECLGCDLSPELVKLARQKAIYKTVQVVDLSRPTRFDSDHFDAATVVGVMTYLEPNGPVLDELCRVVRPGGLVLFTHRSDKVGLWQSKHEQLVADGKWEQVEITEELPYLPNNPEFGDTIKVIIHVFRICKKTSAELQATPKRGAAFYVQAARGFLQGVHEDGEVRDPVETLTISGAGGSIVAAVEAATACVREGVGAVTKVETSYSDIWNRSSDSSRDIAGIRIQLKKA